MQVGAQRLVAALVDLERAGEHLPAGPWGRFRCHTADLPGEARPAGQADHRPVTPDLLHFLPFRPCWLRFESDSSPWTGRGHDHVTVSTMSGATASSTLFTFDRLTWNACGSPGTPGTPDPPDQPGHPINRAGKAARRSALRLLSTFICDTARQTEPCNVADLCRWARELGEARLRCPGSPRLGGGGGVHQRHRAGVPVGQVTQGLALCSRS